MTDFPHACAEIVRAIQSPTVPMHYSDKFREYSIEYSEGSSVQLIDHCPFCGTQLPVQMRDEWFDRLDNAGIDPHRDDIPELMRSGAWWRAEAGEG